MTPWTILGAWEKTGLSPYNPGMVLKKIQAMKEKCAVTPLPELLPFIKHTPKGVQKVIQLGQYLLLKSKEMNLSCDFQIALEHYVKGSNTTVYSQCQSARS